MRPVYWTAPALWPGETAVIIGGGPSLTPAQVDACRGRVRAIAVNDALRLCPWASVHYFCDAKWWNWHHGKDWYKAFRGLRVTLENLQLREDPTLNGIQNVGKQGLCEKPNGVMTGANSGYQCINLAVHLGFTRLLLLGFDMKGRLEGRNVRTHWFGEHPGGTSPTVYSQMLEHFPTLIAPLKARGVEVINCTPDSALRCFPMRRLEEALGIEKKETAAA